MAKARFSAVFGGKRGGIPGTQRVVRMGAFGG
jgi:hypothetical protein